MYRFTIALCLAVLVFVSGLCLADIPKLINYQGMLTESDGATPVADGQYNLGFKIYGSESGTDSVSALTDKFSALPKFFLPNKQNPI